MSANGQLKSSELMTVQPGIKLPIAGARAFKRWRAALKKSGQRLAVAPPAGGYRNLFVQGDMKRNPRDYNLNANSAVGLADPGFSTHGEERARVDVVGVSVGTAVSTGRAFGFTREFGANDPNHFEHDGHTASKADPLPKLTDAEIMKLARYLDKMSLGTSTSAITKAKRGPVYWWGIQRWGHAAGVYGGALNMFPTYGTRLAEAELLRRRSNK